MFVVRLLVWLSLVLVSHSRRPLCIGHRGASAYFPENTPLAFMAAMLQGADGIELDVHLTSDNRLVILHDDTLDRTTNGTGYVWDRPYDYVRSLRTRFNYTTTATSDNHEDWTTTMFGFAGNKLDEWTRVPLFTDVVRLLYGLDHGIRLYHHVFRINAPYPKRLIIDTKPTNPLSIIDVILNDLAALNLPDTFLSSIVLGIWDVRFYKYTRSKTNLPVVHISKSAALSHGSFFDVVDGYSLDMQLFYNQTVTTKSSANGSKDENAWEFLETVRQSPNGREVYLWTVNEVTMLERGIKKVKADAVLSDYPDRCVDALNRS